MRIICCQFGEKFTQWHVENLKYMIDNFSGLKYDSFEVIKRDLYGNWYNKLQMYDRFRDGENLYFDLDMIIFGKLPNLIKNNFTLLDDSYWREPAHTPLNSSVVSWTGDVSYIWKKFKSNEEYFLKKYNKGSDEFYYRELKYYQTYPKVCESIANHIYKKPDNYNMLTLGQYHHIMEKGWNGWYSNFFLPR
ncbi:MAG: hypothetical protein CBD57_03175 [Candidatus Pelagibacter sp. TMED197]|jgi:hypothetical protein|nr:MAG: hypothetical protein CBD57_03175 [Candidatus Pelagibacter sp. TMED197]|tara:strand:- start:2739 stop:3311 length:573 start_codon:yes stop_codon:yes gene_type:complete